MMKILNTVGFITGVAAMDVASSPDAKWKKLGDEVKILCDTMQSDGWTAEWSGYGDAAKVQWIKGDERKVWRMSELWVKAQPRDVAVDFCETDLSCLSGQNGFLLNQLQDAQNKEDASKKTELKLSYGKSLAEAEAESSSDSYRAQAKLQVENIQLKSKKEQLEAKTEQLEESKNNLEEIVEKDGRTKGDLLKIVKAAQEETTKLRIKVDELQDALNAKSNSQKKGLFGRK